MLVLDNTAIAEARLLHPSREGYFTVAQRHAPDERGRTWSQRGYAMSSLQQVLSAVEGIPDYYISQGSFINHLRGNATIKAMSCSFVDLDCYKIGLAADDATVHALIQQSTSCGMPAPSYVMNSGRGLYAKWIFDQPVTGTLIPHWQKLQSVLNHMFLAFGSDSNARDLARVLRASSTLNSKSGQNVRVIYQSGQTYRFADLAAVAAQVDMGGFLKGSVDQARRIRIKQDALETVPSDLGALTEYAAAREPIMLEAFSRQSLNWTRFLDLRDLMIMRNGAAKGSRDVMLFWMTAMLAHSGTIDAANFWSEVQNLLRAFPVSRDFDPLQDGSLETLRRRIEMHSRGEKVTFNGAKVSPIYTPSNDYLINALNITDAEQQHLKTVISAMEKQRRSDLKNPGRLERRLERNESRQMAVQLQRQGLNMTEIAGRIGVHKSTVSRWLAPDASNRTRGHQFYKAQVWTAERVNEWLQKRKEMQQERQRQIDLMREHQEHIEKTRIEQVKLQTSVVLMRIFEKIKGADVASREQEIAREETCHPLSPPQDEVHPERGFDLDHDDGEDEDSYEYERPRF
jgi:transposase